MRGAHALPAMLEGKTELAWSCLRLGSVSYIPHISNAM